MFLHHLHTQASFVSDLLIRPAFTSEASHFLFARRKSCEVRETRVSGCQPICRGSANLFALNEKIRPRQPDGIDVRYGDRYSQVLPFRVMKGFLCNCWLRCINSGCFPTSLEPATTIENLIRNRRVSFKYSRSYGPCVPGQTKLPRRFVLICQLEVPAQQHGRQRQPAQKCFKSGACGMFTLEQSDATQCNVEFRIQTTEQSHLRLAYLTLPTAAHDRDYASKSWAAPKAEANRVLAFARLHVIAIKGRLQQIAAIGKNIDVAHDLAPWVCG